jgi:hypothetical protein
MAQNKKLIIRLPGRLGNKSSSHVKNPGQENTLPPRVVKPLPRRALVPEPTTNKLPAWNNPISTFRSLAARWKRWFRTSDHIASKWAAEVPTFRLADVDYDDLVKAGKNTPSALKKARDKMAEMQVWPADACSGRWVDRKGKLLLTYFADHIVSRTIYILFQVSESICLNASLFSGRSSPW